ncbi:MAG: WecB/TagA/CpsF family glycosyltransferase [Clostridiales bacterium]|nr:WecB/TagA/CpsF family glycosyltransferase [Clostridiales bacterium]
MISAQTRSKTEILGIGIDNVDREQAANILMGYIKAGRASEARIILTPNPEMIMLARGDSEYRRIMSAAALNIPDGVGIVLASKIINGEIKENVPGVDLLYNMMSDMAATGHGIYLLGAAPGIAEQAGQNLRRRIPGLNIVGTHDGYFDEEEDKLICEELIRLKPDLALIGISMGKAERWAYSHRHLPVNMIACCGGSLDVWAGRVKRAPLGFRKLGLEWLYRLLSQPKRILRMAVLPKFVLLALLSGRGK